MSVPSTTNNAPVGSVEQITRQKLQDGVDNTEEDRQISKFNAKVANTKKVQY